MIVFFLITFLRACILSSTNDIFTNGFSKNLQWVNIEDYSNFDLSYCDFLVVSMDTNTSIDGIDTFLLSYVREGGNLYLESQNFVDFDYLEKYVQYVVSKTYVDDTFSISGGGIFNGLDISINVSPVVFFTIDTLKKWNFIKINNVPLIGEPIIGYATSLGKGSIIFSSYLFMRDSSMKEIRKRIENYFFPDLSLITDSLDTLYRHLSESLYIESGLFLRVYRSEFEGMPAGKLAIVDVNQNIVGPDTLTIFYMGKFVCKMLSSCHSVSPFLNFYFRGEGFDLSNIQELAVGGEERGEIVFVSPTGEVLGFLSPTYKIGFLPFSLREISPKDRIRFLVEIINIERDAVSIKKQLEYFKGALSGILEGVQDLMVFTIDGRVVQHLSGDNSVVYDFNPLPYGLYIIKLRFKDGRDSLILLNRVQGDK